MISARNGNTGRSEAEPGEEVILLRFSKEPPRADRSNHRVLGVILSDFCAVLGPRPADAREVEAGAVGGGSGGRGTGVQPSLGRDLLNLLDLALPAEGTCSWPDQIRACQTDLP